MRILTVVFFSLKVGLALAINPIDVMFQNGLPETSYIGFSYTATYTFTNNLPFPKLITITELVLGSGFQSDALCNNVTLASKGQPGSSCTTYIEFQPLVPGLSRMKLTLKYDNNVISLRPALSSVVNPLCGTQVYPSNTGIPVPPPIINSIPNQIQITGFRD